MGPTGATGGSRVYASLSNDAGWSIADTYASTKVPLPNSQVLVGATVNGTNTAVTVTAGGNYRLSYCLRTTADAVMDVTLTVSETVAMQTAILSTHAKSTFCRGATVTLTAGDWVSVEVSTVIGPATLITPGGAELLIEKLSP